MLLYGLLGMRAAVLNAAVQKYASIFVPAISYRLYGLSRKACSKNSNFSLEICAQKMVRLPWKTCHKLLYGFCLGNRAKSALNCVQTLLYGLAEIWPWNVCQGAASFSSLLRNLPCSLALLLPICS